MKRILLSLVLMLLVALPVMAQDDEPQLGVHGILNNGETASSEFTEESGMHLYAFAGSLGDVITVRMEGTSDEVDPFVMVLGSNGEMLNWNDDSDGLNAELSVDLPDTGLYFVVATTYQSLYLPESVEGSYQLTLHGANTPEDFVFEDVLVNPPLTQAEFDTPDDIQLTPQNPVALRYVTVQDSVSVSINTLGETDTLLYIFDENGELLAMDDDSAGVGYNAAVNVSLDEPGRYVIIATQRDYLDSISFGAFQLTISRS